MTAESVETILIGDWEVVPDRHLLRRGDRERSVEPRLVQVLVRLASRPGEVFSRADLLQAVWGETLVQEEALTQAVSQLRRVLGDDPRSPRYIETIPKQGYRLVAPVRRSVAATGTPAPQGDRPARRFVPAVLLVAALAAVVGTGACLGRRGGMPAPDLLEARPLTALPGHEAHPALSPDGRIVAFTWRPDADTEFKLHLKRLADDEVIALTDGPGRDTQPSWAPDGERIAFVRSLGGDRRLCTVAAIGGPVRELGPRHTWIVGLDWAPDGQAIVYAAKDVQETPLRVLRLDLGTARIDTLTHPEQLSLGDRLPRVAPDGAHLAFVRGDRGGSRALFVQDLSGGSLRRLTPGFFSVGGLTWAPDGRTLVLSATLRGTYDLWRVPLAGGDLWRLPIRGRRLLDPDWPSADGPLVFVDDELDADIMVGDVEGTADPVVVASSTRLDRTPRFAPDGGRIVLISDRGGNPELWVYHPADGAARQITTFGADALRHPRWSPDSRLVAVNVARDGLLQIVVLDVGTGLQRQVTPADGHYRLGPWSRDGTRIYYSREDGPDWRIGSVRPDGSDSRDEPVSGCHPLAEGLDGGLYYFKETAPGLFRRPAGGTEERAVAPDDLHDLNHLQLTADGYWFARDTEGGPRLAFFAFATGGITEHARLPDGATGEIHVTPDGRRFLCTVIVRATGDLAAVDDLP